MATLRLFASAREAAGTDRATIGADTVGAVLDEARRRFGEHFAAVLASSKVWCNGEPVGGGGAGGGRAGRGGGARLGGGPRRRGCRVAAGLRRLSRRYSTTTLPFIPACRVHT
jgi:molybdopterin synthase sulfur carrier subunit